MTDYMTTDEVADKLRTSPETCRYWRHVGKGPKSFKIGRRVLYAVEDVEAFIAESREAEQHVAPIAPPHIRLGRSVPRNYEPTLKRVKVTPEGKGIVVVREYENGTHFVSQTFASVEFAGQGLEDLDVTVELPEVAP